MAGAGAGKRTVPLDNFPLRHSPYPARLGLELGLGLCFGLGGNVRDTKCSVGMSDTSGA